MWPQWPPTCPFSGRPRLALLISMYTVYAMASYPQAPDARACSQLLGRPLFYAPCQAAVNNLPRGALASIFTTRAHTATNNYVQVPVISFGIEDVPNCMVTISLDGHSRTDQFVSVPWDQVREMAQAIVNTCVSHFHSGGFITYGVGGTFESLINPTAYEPTADDGDNAEIPTPAYVQQPDGTIEFVAIPPASAAENYSKFRGATPNAKVAA